MDKAFWFVFLFLFVLSDAFSEEYGNNNNEPAITIAHVEANVGDVVNVPVTANDFGYIHIFECRIGFSDEVLDFIGFTNVFPGISNMATNQVGNTLLISWFGSPAISIPDGTVLFELQFNFCNNLLECALQGTESPVFLLENYAFITNESFQQIPLELHHGSVYSDNPLRVLGIDQTGEGQVFVNGNPYIEPIIVDNDTVFVLQAVPSEQYIFENWTDNHGNEVSDQPEYGFTMPGHHVFLTANFTEIPDEVYVLTFNVINEFAADVDDAVVTLNGNSYEPGHYVFENLLPGAYNYVINHPCYQAHEGETSITDTDQVINIVLNGVTGDANGDGQFNVLDLITIVNHYVSDHSGLFCFYNADVNQDGVINILDVILLAQMFMDTAK